MKILIVYHHNKPSLRQAFTLVELAIVMVIIALIVSGVLVGQQLMHEARLRSVMNDFSTYSKAIYTYQLKYDALPGNDPNAYTNFSSYTLNCTNTLTSNSDTTSAGGCNGDGQGYIGYNITNESMRAFQFLGIGGFISGSFDGVLGSNFITGTNVPGNKLNKAAFYFITSGTQFNEMSNYMLFMEYISASATGALTGIDAYAIDVKIDDGLPLSGIFQVQTILTQVP